MFPTFFFLPLFAFPFLFSNLLADRGKRKKKFSPAALPIFCTWKIDFTKQGRFIGKKTKEIKKLDGKSDSRKPRIMRKRIENRLD